MNNPFEIIDKRLRHIEDLLLDIKHPTYSGQVPAPTVTTVQPQLITEPTKGNRS